MRRMSGMGFRIGFFEWVVGEVEVELSRCLFS